MAKSEANCIMGNASKKLMVVPVCDSYLFVVFHVGGVFLWL